MGTGVLFALAAGLMWGLVFVAPLLLPEYPAALQSFGRYLAFGLIALPLAWLDRTRLAQLTRADWIEAAKLGAIGNIVYYLFLASSIQRAGGALPTMIVGTLPVVIAITSNLRDHRRDGRLPWARLAPSLGLIAAGIALVNHSELAALRAGPQADVARYALGAALALGAVACWTWYPLRNADWLRAHVGSSPGAARRPDEGEPAVGAARRAPADRSATTWATAQGLATLPLAAAGYAAAWAWAAATGSGFDWPFGPRPAFFVGLMLAIGLFASWLGTLCWNQASQRLPTTLVGQLIVFETLAALAYAFTLRGRWPEPAVAAGIAMLVGGVLWALRVRPEPPVMHGA
jgi:drug/metabolite transporter (DMT)-like permease